MGNESRLTRDNCVMYLHPFTALICLGLDFQGINFCQRRHLIII